MTRRVLLWLGRRLNIRYTWMFEVEDHELPALWRSLAGYPLDGDAALLDRLRLEIEAELYPRRVGAAAAVTL